MARIRTIKPEFFTSETVASLTTRARLTWIGLWTYCDDYGRCRDNVKLIKAAVWALDDVSLDDVEDDLTDIAEAGLIQRYTICDKAYIQVTSWLEHQRVSHPTASRFPSLNGSDSGEIPEDSGEILEDDGFFLGGKERKGTGKGKDKTSVADRAGEEVRPDVEALCEHLRDRVVGNGSRKPTITGGWRTAARLMLDRDKRPLDEAHRLIDWAHNDNFWRSVVKSMPKFREQFDTLRLRAEGQNGHRPYQNPKPEDYSAPPDWGDES